VALVVEELGEGLLGGCPVEADQRADEVAEVAARSLASANDASSPTPAATRIRCRSARSSAVSGCPERTLATASSARFWVRKCWAFLRNWKNS
jgi:hypothetical protein